MLGAPFSLSVVDRGKGSSPVPLHNSPLVSLVSLSSPLPLPPSPLPFFTPHFHHFYLPFLPDLFILFSFPFYLLLLPFTLKKTTFLPFLLTIYPLKNLSTILLTIFAPTYLPFLPFYLPFKNHSTHHLSYLFTILLTFYPIYLPFLLTLLNHFFLLVSYLYSLSPQLAILVPSLVFLKTLF
jgi:hypothetical protein